MITAGARAFGPNGRGEAYLCGGIIKPLPSGRERRAETRSQNHLREPR